MTNEELVEKIQVGEDVADNMLRLWQQNRGFIHKIVNQYKAFAEVEDLEQEGYLGLNEAVRHYNPDEGVTFLHYAYYWIKQYIVRYIKGNGIVRLPEHIQERIRKYNRIVQEWQQDYNRSPSDEEICCFYGVSEKMLNKVHKARIMVQIGSLDVPVGEETEKTLYDLLPAAVDEEERTIEKIQAEQLCAVLWSMVDTLPGNEPEIIRKRYREELAFKEIGQQLGISVEAVRQWEYKGLRELRKPSKARILERFLEDGRIYNSALHGNGVSSFNRTWTSSTEKIALKRIEADEEEESRRRAELQEDYIRLWKKKSGEPTEEDLEIIEQVVESDLRYELPHRGS